MLIPYDGLSIIYIVSVHWILGILKSPPIIMYVSGPFFCSLTKPVTCCQIANSFFCIFENVDDLA